MNLRTFLLTGQTSRMGAKNFRVEPIAAQDGGNPIKIY
jgi:hypothetical protein